MTNKPSKKEKGLERIVQLICVAIAVFGILLFGSCEPVMCEDCYTYTYSDGSTDWVCVEYDCTNDYAQDLGFTKANANTYYNYETLVDGVVYERDFDAYWEITDNVVRFQKDEGEGNGIETYIQFAISRYEGDVMYLLSGTTEIPYQFSSGENGDLIMTHMSGEYVITYKLSI